MDDNINLEKIVKEKGIEEGIKVMKEKGCIIKYGFKPPLNACQYSEDCTYCWKETLEEVSYRLRCRDEFLKNR